MSESLPRDERAVFEELKALKDAMTFDQQNKLNDFAIKILSLHGEKARSYRLFHLISNSTISANDEHTILHFDFEGDDSIEKYLRAQV